MTLQGMLTTLVLLAFTTGIGSFVIRWRSLRSRGGRIPEKRSLLLLRWILLALSVCLAGAALLFLEAIRGLAEAI